MLESIAQLREPKLDILVHCVGDEIGTVFRGGPAAIRRVKGASAGLASIPMYDVARNPSLYSVLHESKVDDGLVPPAVAIDLFRFAVRATRRARVIDCGVWPQLVMGRAEVGWRRRMGLLADFT